MFKYLLLLSAFCIYPTILYAGSSNAERLEQKEQGTMKNIETITISGKFDVSMTPAEFSIPSEGSNILGRMILDKTYHGKLSAKSQGEMLSARTSVESSAGYVAIEQVTGKLEGKQGTFVLQHFGVMSGGEQHLILEVVPDSATGELNGLSGKMAIRIEEGQHFYDFEYQLGD